MPTIPSSQSKKPFGYSETELTQAIQSMQLSLKNIQLKNLSLYAKITRLKRSSSSDPIQQLQTDAITDIYAIVKDMQVFLNPLLSLYPSNPFE